MSLVTARWSLSQNASYCQRNIKFEIVSDDNILMCAEKATPPLQIYVLCYYMHPNFKKHNLKKLLYMHIYSIFST
jgi:hypothetical protein